MRKVKFKQYEVVVFEPSYETDNGDYIQKGELVYFLGPIPNMPGHCLVASRSGMVTGSFHLDDFRKATDDEV